MAAFECIHDLSDPVGVLRSARRMVKAGGTVLVMDERVPDAFTGPGEYVVVDFVRSRRRLIGR